jgi:hypothetical protein
MASAACREDIAPIESVATRIRTRKFSFSSAAAIVET